jgi:DNA mismatch repair protein MutS
MTFRSILFRTPRDEATKEAPEAPVFFRDLNLDQVVHSITAEWKEYNLSPLYYEQLTSLDEITYRQEVMEDLEDKTLVEAVKSFSARMRAMRTSLDQANKLDYYKYAKERGFLRAVEIYCEAVTDFLEQLSRIGVKSQGFQIFDAYLTNYVESNLFRGLLADAKGVKSELSRIRYYLLLRDGRVTVRHADSECDYSAAVEETFEKFRAQSTENFWLETQKWSGMNHVEAQIQERVARLYPEVFSSLDTFCNAHSAFVDEIIARFDREVQFYVSYLDYLNKFRRVGLKFCRPRLLDTSKEIRAHRVFDLALASKLIDEKRAVITNDFALTARERVFVVSGANQGGKTTFARTVGQLHYLAALGCLVPGEEAEVFLFDRLFTHFEREEDIRNLRGKLQDDLLRIRQILDEATPRSLIVMNEIFASTTLKDAVYLGRKIMERISALDVIAVCVTFLEELASFDEKTVSIVSTVDPANPAVRTFRLERRPADGLAYALAIAQKYRVTHDCLKERLEA